MRYDAFDRRITPVTDLLFRFGGEEFVLVPPGVSTDEAVVIADRTRTGAAGAYPGGLPVTVSFGASGIRWNRVSGAPFTLSW
ncbi:hypothetical protein [Actinoplanes sp. ATCC 53533]|uniref:hypothetical protein n=1 Tax=Actinoplanes sp. ATCC 53533 TaxID=1288362 RepID=UPI0018F38957|nr:hypothetical protein [Actinoplanes sp. ATCC 53533]